MHTEMINIYIIPVGMLDRKRILERRRLTCKDNIEANVTQIICKDVD